MFKKIIPAACLLTWAVSANGAEVQGVVDQLQKSYDHIQSIEANFEQTYRSKRFDEKINRGKLAIVKPGKMRWDYREPKGKVLVSNGKEILLYDPEDHQALVTPQPAQSDLPVALAFLWGGAKLTDKFTVSLKGEKKTEDKQETTLRCLPKEPIPNVKEVFLTVRSGEPMLVVASRVIDSLEGESEIRFTDIRVNPSIENRRFEFKPPKNTPIVSMPSLNVKP
ncbi:MAG TPA: outer membrane lipoprotein carrier protein LolA [Bdellovibrionota bacterium]|nr:outer membrane lipoprotein carrier protein LolA [Bdellovibrionota bacterium]